MLCCDSSPTDSQQEQVQRPTPHINTDTDDMPGFSGLSASREAPDAANSEAVLPNESGIATSSPQQDPMPDTSVRSLDPSTPAFAPGVFGQGPSNYQPPSVDDAPPSSPASHFGQMLPPHAAPTASFSTPPAGGTTIPRHARRFHSLSESSHRFVTSPDARSPSHRQFPPRRLSVAEQNINFIDDLSLRMGNLQGRVDQTDLKVNDIANMLWWLTNNSNGCPCLLRSYDPGVPTLAGPSSRPHGRSASYGDYPRASVNLSDMASIQQLSAQIQALGERLRQPVNFGEHVQQAIKDLTLVINELTSQGACPCLMRGEGLSPRKGKEGAIDVPHHDGTAASPHWDSSSHEGQNQRPEQQNGQPEQPQNQQTHGYLNTPADNEPEVGFVPNEHDQIAQDWDSNIAHEGHSFPDLSTAVSMTNQNAYTRESDAPDTVNVSLGCSSSTLASTANVPTRSQSRAATSTIAERGESSRTGAQRADAERARAQRRSSPPSQHTQIRYGVSQEAWDNMTLHQKMNQSRSYQAEQRASKADFAAPLGEEVEEQNMHTDKDEDNAHKDSDAVIDEIIAEIDEEK